jgi:NADP-dependent 3-hydroxy acid dehydrogenase YdfG
MALLSGTVVVVSGVGPGLGRSIALASAREGADLVLAARTGSRLDEVAKEVAAFGQRAVAVPTDITDEQSAANLAQAAPRAADAMRALCEQSPGTARPGHRYALSDFGLTAEQVDERFAGYHRARA